MISFKRFRVLWLLLFLAVGIYGCKKKKFFLKPIKDKDIEVLKEYARGIIENEGEETDEDEINSESNGGELLESDVEIIKYTITVFVDQPGSGGDRDMYEIIFGFDPGHAFIKLEVEDADGNKKDIVVGFYPISEPENPTNPIIDGHVSDDKLKEVYNDYEVSKSFEVSRENFIKAIDYIESIRSSKPKYDGNNFNCADFVIQTAKAAEINLPDTQATWTGLHQKHGRISGRGSSPGNLGEDLRLLPD